MKYKFRYIKMIALLLSMVMILCSVPMTVVAEPVENGSAADQLPDGIISESMESIGDTKIAGIAEIEELREQNVKHFKRTDGTYEMVVYPTAVHRMDANGVWQDIDNNLSLQTVKGNQLYATADSRTYFTKSFVANQELFALSENGYSISMTFVSNQLSTGSMQTSVLPLSETRVENAPAKATSTEYTSVKEAAAINNKSSIYYSNINATTDLEYILNGNNIKENIIVKSAGSSYKYTFDLALDGLVAVLNENNTVSLIDPKTAEVQYRIPVPYMYDASGVRSYDVTYSLQATEAGTYRLSITADAAWINADGRAFPVVIDPMIENMMMENTYIDSSTPNVNYGAADRMEVGSTQIAFIKGNIPNMPDGSMVIDAIMTVTYYYDADIDSDTTTLGAYQILNDWNPNTLTWNTANQNANLGISTTCLDTQIASAETGAYIDAPLEVEFDIKDAVVAWHDGTVGNYGIAIKYEDGLNDPIYLHNYSTSHPEYCTYYTINYASTIPDGVYAFENVGNSGLWMDTQNDSDQEGKHIQQYNYTTSPAATFSRGGLFKISRVANTTNRYVIRLMTNNLLTFTKSGTEVLTTVIDANDKDVDPGDTFYITYSDDGGFTISPYGSSYCITANQTTASGAAGAPNSYLTVVATDDVQAQGRWYLRQYTGNEQSEVFLHAPSEWRSKGIQIGITYTITPVSYSTYINVNTPKISVLENSEIVSASWNSTLYKLTLIAEEPGNIVLSGKILHSKEGNEKYSGLAEYWIVPKEGTYYIKNIETGKYIDIQGPSRDSGAYIQQWAFHTGNSERWIVEQVADMDGYIRLKSVHSGLYIGVDSSNTSVVCQYSIQNDYTLWRIDRAEFRDLIFTCKATSSSDVVLTVPQASTTNGTNLVQATYTDNMDYSDEWQMYKIEYSAVVNNYYDKGFLVRYEYTDSQAQEVIEEYTLAVAEVYVKKLGLALQVNDAQYFNSALDQCKGTVTSDNV
ncbi:MAG: RICIN domain-containing protein, partial [Clostridia bacterium]|nr:RICIN domain-containing protein [Clostridia bacterium]